MTAILGYTELIKESTSDEQLLDAISIVHRNGTHLINIINDILDLSKIEASQLRVETVETRVLELLQEVVETCPCTSRCERANTKARSGW